MITGIDNYTRAIEFGGPEYLPCKLAVNLAWLCDKDESKQDRIRELQSRFPRDIIGGLNVARNATEPEKHGDVTRWKDEWGTGWEDDGHGAKTEIYPLMTGYDSVDQYGFPDPHLQGRFDAADDALQERSDCYVLMQRSRNQRK